MNTEYGSRMEYEHFLRGAFGLQSGILIDRYGDPAGAADTDSFTPNDIEGVKAATAYAMMIYRRDLVNKRAVPESDHIRLDNFVKAVINSSSLEDISGQITGFNESFVNR